MGGVLTFVTRIKNYSFNQKYMAEHKREERRDDDRKPKHHSSGGMSFGMEIILFIIVLFILWALMKKPSENVDKPFIQADTAPTVIQ